ncbi:spore coat protein GerQ [Alkalihalobacillus trypoxylicola]|uniref:spore coat protein GerQ n=1 Tax=Alkalihalobacillus trypoxylicola TaxID=519424 RepID=UPI0004357F5D|nr:spore coat protein GerQ [Alkalihalobacillus trypoxylicola]GAF64374.1 spore coat protein GerQ [Bacillus sp. TS-2]
MYQYWPGAYNQQGTQVEQQYGNQSQPTPQSSYSQPQQRQSQNFSAANYQVPGFALQQQGGGNQTSLPLEQSFIENILRLNKGKIASFYMTFENNSEWNARVFRGRLEEAGRDHIIVSNPENGEYYLLLMVTLDYVVFDEPIEYEYPFGSGAQLTQYAPR